VRLKKREEKVAWLRRVPLFSELTTTQLESIEPFVEEVEVEAGQMLIRQEGVGSELLVMIDGAAEVTRDGTRLRTLGPGDVIGEIALLDGRPRTATVTATDHTVLLTISKRAFDTVLDRAPGMSQVLLRTLAARLRHATERT
jgi:CRP/FNR family cyclic AMP-dependent transcriptional regulator